MAGRCRGSLVAGLVLSSALLLSACTPAPNYGDEQAAPAAETVSVETRDITAALTFPVSVSAGLEFDVTSPVDGKFVEEDSRFLVQGAESTVAVEIPQGASVEQVLVEAGRDVVTGLPLLTAAATGFVLKATVDPKLLPRLITPPIRVRAQLEGGSAAFDCTLVNPLPTFTGDGEAYYGCAMPKGLPVVEGMTGRLVLVFSEAKQVLALPIAAVSGTVDSGEVTLPDGEVRSVALGITDGQYIEIKSGLSVGDVVSLPSPSLLDTP